LMPGLKPGATHKHSIFWVLKCPFRLLTGHARGANLAVE
jgi:hypothetical protein